MAKCLSPSCGHEWTPRKEAPVKCPKCQNANWDRPRKVHCDSEDIHSFQIHDLDRRTKSTNVIDENGLRSDSSNVVLDPDGAMMKTVPDNRIAKAKERAMELLGRIK